MQEYNENNSYKGENYMTIKKTKTTGILILSLFLTLSIGFLSGCGEKNTKSGSEEKTSIKEVDGQKVKVTENGDGSATVEIIGDEDEK